MAPGGLSKGFHDTAYPPAVVIGLGVTGLGMIRSLSHKRVRIAIPIIGIDSDSSQPTAYTRLCDKYSCEDVDSENLITFITDLSQTFPVKPVLLLSKDVTVLLVSKHMEEVRNNYHILLPENDITELLMDKTQFSSYAEENGFCIPKTFRIDNSDDLSQAVMKLV